MSFKELFNKDGLKSIFFILIGTLMSALGINMFLVHAKLLSGGVSGIALIIQYFTRFPAGYTIFILNIPLLILSYKKVNLRFTVFTIIGTISLSFFLVLTYSLKNLLSIDDPLLLSLYGGVLNGLGMGIVFSNHGSTGGLDIISVIVKKKYDNFEIGRISFTVNSIIVALGAVFFGLTSALYTLVSMYITSYMVDKTIKGFNRQKMVLIVTDKVEEVSKEIMTTLHRGVTLLHGEGAYTGVSKKVLYSIVSLTQLPQLKLIVHQTDPNAFLSILDVSEVHGKGFVRELF
ncbi:YitT family protein [Caldanaerobacter sp.]|uniref:YitT family protein n=1 Tax=Caldanaerobacter sp. TaxID=2930036 RepID=UPI003C76B7DD